MTERTNRSWVNAPTLMHTLVESSDFSPKNPGHNIGEYTLFTDRPTVRVVWNLYFQFIIPDRSYS